MKYPEIIKKGDRIEFICPSNSLSVRNKLAFEKALEFWHKNGFQTKISANVFKGKEFVSAEKQERAQEFESAWLDENNSALISVSGGEFMMEILPYLNAKKLEVAKPKTFVGFSDNTILTHWLLTHLDTCSLYHYNAYSFNTGLKHESQKYGFEALTKRRANFSSFKKFENERKFNADGQFEDFNFQEKVNWKILQGKTREKFKGRLVGGCIDILLMFLGTKYDKTHDFLTKYEKDGFIWVLESCDLDPREVKRALWQMKENGWFRYVKGFVFGRPLLPEPAKDLTMEKAILSELEQFNVPIIFDADFGHKPPALPLYIGAVGEFAVGNGKGKVLFEFV